jgi:hypothetical protein
LATTDDARVHCAVLKIRAVPVAHRHHDYGRAGPLKATDKAAVSLRTQQRARPARPPGSGFPCSSMTAAVLTCPG